MLNIPISWRDAGSGTFEPPKGSEAFLTARSRDGNMTIRIETAIPISASIAFIQERTIEARAMTEDSISIWAQCGECEKMRPVNYWYGGTEPLCRECSKPVLS